MSIDAFREVRERVSAESAARHYGIQLDRRGWALCPFHRDRRPSMSFRAGRFRCWACGVSGDSIDFTGRLLGLDPLGAVRRLNDDFRLGLPLDRRQTPAERRTAEAEARKRKELADSHAMFEAWRKDTALKLVRCVYLGNLVDKLGMPLDDLSGLAQEVYLRREFFEWLSDTLANGTAEEQLGIWNMRGEVEAWTERLLQDWQKNSRSCSV